MTSSVIPTIQCGVQNAGAGLNARQHMNGCNIAEVDMRLHLQTWMLLGLGNLHRASNSRCGHESPARRLQGEGGGTKLLQDVHGELL